MTTQLHLLTEVRNERQLTALPDWRIDDETREACRRGVALCREVLRQSNEEIARRRQAEMAAAAESAAA